MTPAARRTAAQRQRNYRQRVRTGEIALTIRVKRPVIKALLKRGMSDADSRNRKLVAQELAVVLEQWAEHWKTFP